MVVVQRRVKVCSHGCLGSNCAPSSSSPFHSQWIHHLHFPPPSSSFFLVSQHHLYFLPSSSSFFLVSQHHLYFSFFFQLVSKRHLSRILCVTQKRAFMPVYVEKVEIWSGVTDPSQTDRQQNVVLLSLYKNQNLSWVTQNSADIANGALVTVYWMKIKDKEVSRKETSASESESGYSVATFLVRMWIIIMKNIIMRIEKWFENDLLTILSFISIEKHGSNGRWFKFKWGAKHK